MRVLAEIDVGGVDGYRSVTLVILVSQTGVGYVFGLICMYDA